MRHLLISILVIASVHTATARTRILHQRSLSRWHIAPANYSGITTLDDNRYAVVDDKSTLDGFHIFTININPHNGKIKAVNASALISQVATDSAEAVRRSRLDCEDIIYVPSSNSVFIAQEYGCAVAEYNLDGKPTGRQLALPDYFQLANIQRNAGFEALAYNDSKQTFYLTTELPLKQDGDLHRIVCFGADLQPCGEIRYRMDAPELKSNVKYYARGIVAMTAMPNGNLLIMERELSIPTRYIGGKCRIKLYEITDSGSSSKHLFATFTTRINRLNYANYEGMCLGPTLSNGHRTLLLINDSQAGARKGCFRLKDYLKIIVLP